MNTAAARRVRDPRYPLNRPCSAAVLMAVALSLVSVARAAPEKTAIEIGVIPGALKFDVSRFDVRAGGAVELTLHNNGLMPHNLVIGSKPGSADAIVEAAMAIAANGYEVHFVPDSPLVAHATKLLNAKEKQTIRFTAPRDAGEYPYVCTFPGHGVIMRGVMRVRAEGEALEDAVAEKNAGATLIDNLAESTVTPRPMGTVERPLVMRTFVPNLGFDGTVLAHHERGLPSPRYDPGKGQDTGGEYKLLDGIPATVSVNFGERLSYVWDTTECRLLYAWTDGFMDMTDYWGGGAGGSRKSFGYLANPVGTLVHKTAGAFPLRIGASADAPTPQYLGYRLLAGTPVFRYRLGKATVHEQIVPGDGDTIAIQYRIADTDGPIRLTFDDQLKPLISADRGKWDGSTLTIPAQDGGGEGTQFVLMIRKQDLGALGPKQPDPIWARDAGDALTKVGRIAEGKDAPKVAGKLVPGATIYQDRDYTFGEMPDELHGAEYVVGFNNDTKGRTAYALKVDKPTVIYVLLDQRQRQAPFGKKSPAFTKTRQTVATSHNWTFDVYRAEVEPGEYQIGPQSSDSMYVIAAKRK